ncbi:Diaminohydroxyphosphoribosylaminopyrimidine deaminase [Pantoea sp. AS-PWVM4]|uniref:bifunctional diaminohydroxyphosphoribosylaminopyrimidine deaminase/5-amino-6-(5-phosphoribosylamino)uracil reductase RibD n=1 Tax=Pantoea sp. AS-PWVM4 TaxID=1332069 RepID=UPI0003AC677F|nr:bifunctional diaminohydroxyphosphoribosylaminopyrimidine deaminase/5-amino-6-(5-phosphoribosylamino)uracil reductase RibD [Pantoea sp. AS-PWVM4]ERK09103.1 Diaminohydroxyphosphoribosylaminopyrimidine deaminase [Pantoea sp. AS-PWVM4]
MNKPETYMLLALECSRNALPDCRPNPPVGCVIVRNGEVVSSGFTQSPGLHHAEIAALSKLEIPVNDCDIYVTLEPCSFQGRTPSCAKTLASLKPNHIYIALLDPHPKNQGAGIEILQHAGISFTLGICQNEVSEFLSEYLISSDL